MRLVAKFSLALIASLVCVLAVTGWLQVRREVALFEGDMARDQAAFARALVMGAEAAATQGGVRQAQQVVAAAAARQRRVRVRWIWVDDPTAGLTAPERRALHAGHALRRVVDDPTGGRRSTVEPVEVPGAPAAAIVLSEPLAPQRDAIRRTALEVASATLISIGVCALLAVLLGMWFVGRPMRALYDLVRRVGAGDLAVELPVRSRDELGLLARELNGMVHQLAAARDRVAAETEARIAALEQLRHADRLRTLGQLASGVAHELGTPLGVVSGRAKMIAAGGLDATAVTRNATIIHEQADRMTRIIRQLLDFSRRRRAALGVADVRGVAAQTLDLLAGLASGRRVRCVLDTPDAPFDAMVDRGQLQQALTNLVVNGIHAMPRGGTLRVRVDRRVAAAPDAPRGATAEWVCVAVSDEGTGIAPEHLDHIFEPFFTTKDIGEGTGLGLAVTWGIVREHGGWIDIDTAVGKGTTFRVFLPTPAHELAAQAVSA